MEECCKRPYFGPKSNPDLIRGEYIVNGLYNQAYEYIQIFARDFVFNDVFDSILKPAPVSIKLVSE